MLGCRWELHPPHPPGGGLQLPAVHTEPFQPKLQQFREHLVLPSMEIPVDTHCATPWLLKVLHSNPGVTPILHFKANRMSCTQPYVEGDGEV